MTFPIPEHETWFVRDASKLDTYMTCARKYFYEYILGWRSEAPAHDLYFGESWHKTREYMLLHGYEDVTGAYNAFINHYREKFPPETDELYIPKTPKAVELAIFAFAVDQERRNDLSLNELLFTEISGSVPIDEKRVLYFRMDSVLRNLETYLIFSWDHKSTKRFSRPWQDNFYLCIQNFVYTHCLYCMYPIEEVKGVEFCGTCFEHLKRASKARAAGYHISFQRVPAWKTTDQMNVSLWDVIQWLDELDRDMDRLSHCSESDKVMECFKRNPTACTKYYGCQWHDFCMSWSNPLQRCFEPPLGFIEEHWDPRKMETTNKMQLEWKGDE